MRVMKIVSSVLGVCLTMLVLAARAFAQEEAESVFELSSTPIHKEIARGEPLFLKLVLRNRSDTAQSVVEVAAGGPITSANWRLEIGRGDEALREVKLSSVERARKLPAKPLTLAAGGEAVDYVTVWFAARGDVRGERDLVFGDEGAYRYRITFRLRAIKGKRPAQDVVTEGRVTVAATHKGFAGMLRGLKTIMSDDSVVPWKHVDALDALLVALKDSPYARFVKWLRIRSYLEDGADEAGMNALEGPRGPERAKRLMVLAEELLVDAPEIPPIHCDALAMKGLSLIVLGKMEEARKILADLESKYPPTRGMRRLRTWAY